MEVPGSLRRPLPARTPVNKAPLIGPDVAGSSSGLAEAFLGFYSPRKERRAYLLSIGGREIPAKKNGTNCPRFFTKPIF